jgi:hypothetical protein
MVLRADSEKARKIIKSLQADKAALSNQVELLKQGARSERKNATEAQKDR